MSDSKQKDTAGEPQLWVARRDHELRARFEQLRALNSAWSLLAPLGLSDAGLHIVETGRAVRAALAELAAQPFESRNRDEFPKLDKLLDAVEREMIAKIFSSELDGLQKLTLRDLVLGIGDIADLSENVADRMMIMSLKRRV